MNTGLISTRYAAALLKYAIELDQQKDVYSALKFLLKVCGNVPELREALQTHSIAKSEKKKIIIAACGGNVPSTLDEMLDLIIKNERQVLIDYIALRYIDRIVGLLTYSMENLLPLYPWMRKLKSVCQTNREHY